MTENIVLAGFGGQGVLFAGKVIAYAGLQEDRYLSWLPSYGPEMRGGTANCSVCLSDEPVGSPLILHPNVLIVMNLPSYEKFIDTVEPGGKVMIDSSLIDVECNRRDISCSYVPATTLAETKGLKGLSNMILLGRMLAETQFADVKSVEEAVRHCIPPKKKHLEEPNLLALHLGMEYASVLAAANQ